MSYNPITNPLNVAINEISTGGGKVDHYVSTGTPTTGDVVSATAGKITGWYIYNDLTTVARISFYDQAGGPIPTVGNTGAAFRFSIVVPPSAGANVALPAGIQFTSGIVFNIGSEVADGGSTPAALNKVSVNIFYKN